MDAVKTCTRCRQTKPLTEFHRCCTEKDGAYYVCKICRVGTTRQHYARHKDRVLAANRAYFRKNFTKVRAYRRQWEVEKMRQEKAINSEWYRQRLALRRARIKTDRSRRPWLYAWRGILKGVLERQGARKVKHTAQILGYSERDLKMHLEALFLPGMSWEHRKNWHVDHIRPVSSFPVNTPLAVVNALSNLRPVWAVDNLKKGARHERVA